MRTSICDSAVVTQAVSYMPFQEAQGVSAACSCNRIYNRLQEDARKPWFEAAVFIVDGHAGMRASGSREIRHMLLLSRNYLTTGVEAGDGLAQANDRALPRL